ncbi:heterokaryon incompatibility protein-domain-containing protein [Achaetomium macrosporum]|uniref:Heterokaryon incompatibility protein-domain-containing protein n=1 Tax=Achaetomium macrosporum TaxID=79813 RepID=A0AAN7CF14_9PEZI|nr:heterokaryon incompatibility protein-domain-containing protein [Achaetomium macrosporum]
MCMTPRRPEPDETNERAALIFADKLLSHCRSEHNCAISVGAHDDDIELVCSGTLRAQYVCLSHCWGSRQPLKTTKKTLRSHLRKIPWESLPNTFRDAIRFTRALGIPYIWIDSLCIIQDDRHDWLRESQKVARIFQNCYLTVAATAGADGRAGLYTYRGARSTPVTTTTVDGRAQTVFVRAVPNHMDKWASNRFNRKDFPLLTRGWVLQERILSPRVLHFGSRELLWECNKESYCQCGTQQSDEHEFTKPALHAQKHSDIHGDMQHYWRDLVEEYSRLSLTRSSDKLPAIAGLASDVSSHRGGAQYLAEGYFGNDPRYAERSYRRTRWRAPSWSWASIDGTIMRPQMKPSSLTNEQSFKTISKIILKSDA